MPVSSPTGATSTRARFWDLAAKRLDSSGTGLWNLSGLASSVPSPLSETRRHADDFFFSRVSRGGLARIVVSQARLAWLREERLQVCEPQEWDLDLGRGRHLQWVLSVFTWPPNGV